MSVAFFPARSKPVILNVDDDDDDDEENDDVNLELAHGQVTTSLFFSWQLLEANMSNISKRDPMDCKMMCYLAVVTDRQIE